MTRGDDDFFSSDLDDEEINRKVGPLKGKPAIFLPGERMSWSRLLWTKMPCWKGGIGR